MAQTHSNRPIRAASGPSPGLRRSASSRTVCPSQRTATRLTYRSKAHRSPERAPAGRHPIGQHQRRAGVEVEVLRLFEGRALEADRRIGQHQQSAAGTDSRGELRGGAAGRAIDLGGGLGLEKQRRAALDVGDQAHRVAADQTAAVGAREHPRSVPVIRRHQEAERAARERPRHNAPSTLPDDVEPGGVGRRTRRPQYASFRLWRRSRSPGSSYPSCHSAMVDRAQRRPRDRCLTRAGPVRRL